jgi:hypothetical protein
MTDKKKNEQPVEKAVEKTVAQKIWEDIKDMKIEMFSLPDQMVHQYCKPVDLDPAKLFLTVTAGAVIASLEAIVTPKYNLDVQERFVVISSK